MENNKRGTILSFPSCSGDEHSNQTLPKSKVSKEARQAIDCFTAYLKKLNIPYEVNESGEDVCYNFIFKEENVPGGYLEGCVWFFQKDAEVRVYYNELGAAWCRDSSHKDELLRLLNFINARVFLSCRDFSNGSDNANLLHTPRIYLTEDDEFDITITTIINYRFWEASQDETNDYITAYCPELLDKLALFIFGVLAGKMDAEEAIYWIKKEILWE